MSNYIFKKQFSTSPYDNPIVVEDTTVSPHTFNDIMNFSESDPYPWFCFKVYNDKSYMVFFTWHDENQNKDYAEPIYYIQKGEQYNQIELKQLNPSFFDDVSVNEGGDNYTEFDVGAYFRYTTISDNNSTTNKIKITALEWEPLFELGSALDSLTGYYKFFVTTNINYLSNKDYYNEIHKLSNYKALNILKIKSLANLDKMSWFDTNYGVIENTDYAPGDEIVAFTDNNSSNSYNYYITLPNSQHNEVCLKTNWQGERYILEGCTISDYSVLKSIIYNNSKKNGITEAQAGTFLDDNILSTDNTIIPIGVDLVINLNGSTKLDYKTIYDFIDTYNNNWSNLQVSQAKPIKLDDYYDGGYYILQKGIVSDTMELVRLVKNSSNNITMNQAGNYIKLYCENQNLNTEKIVSNLPLICNSSLVSQKLNKSNFDQFKTAYKAYWSTIGANQKFPIKDIPSTLSNGCVLFYNFNLGYPTDEITTGAELTLGSYVSIDTAKVGKGLTTILANTDYGAVLDDYCPSINLQAMTISLWFKPPQTLTTLTCIAKNRLSNPFIHFYNGQIRCNVSINSESIAIIASNAYTSGVYTHIVVTIKRITGTDSYSCSAFSNGELLNTITVASDTSNDVYFEPYYIFGIDNTGSAMTTGKGGRGACIDEFGIWDRVLTDNEVAELYRAGNDGVSYPFQSYSSVQS